MQFVGHHGGECKDASDLTREFYNAWWWGYAGAHVAF